MTLEGLNGLLGSAFTVSDAAMTLRKVNFVVQEEADAITATAPYWRSDIHIPEDIIEEVGRLNGFDSITPHLPLRDFTAVSREAIDEIRSKIRASLVRAGANEVLTYSFVHGDLLKKVGQDPANGYRIVNSISPDLQYYRQSLVPSLLQLVHPNSKMGYDNFALFEINKVHAREYGVNEDSLPIERNELAFVYANKNNEVGAAFYKVKSYLEFVATQLGLTMDYVPITEPLTTAVGLPFEYRRSAKVVVGTTEIGIVGEFRSSVAKSFKLPPYIAGFVLDTAVPTELTSASKPSYAPLSRYPSTDRDICFQVDTGVAYGQILDAVTMALKTQTLLTQVSLVDIYKADQATVKNVTIRITLTSYDKTLVSDEIAVATQQVIDQVRTATDAVVI